MKTGQPSVSENLLIRISARLILEWSVSFKTGMVHLMPSFLILTTSLTALKSVHHKFKMITTENN